MSNIFTYLVRSTLGALPVNIGVGAIVSPIASQGLNIDATGAVYAVSDGVIDHHHQGLPFDENGRLVVTEDPKVRVDQSVPFSADGFMCLGDGGISYVAQGLAYTALGAIAFTGGSFPVNLYVNPELAGGVDAPEGSNTGAPTAHTWSFATAASQMVDNGDGTFDVITNPASNGGVRRTLTYSVFDNNPDLVVGRTYRLTFEVSNIGSSQLVGGTANISDVTVNSSNNNVPGGTSGQVFVEFTIDATPFSINVRVGTGPTTNTDTRVTISKPTLFEV